MPKKNIKDNDLKQILAEIDILQAREAGVQGLRIKNLQKVIRRKDSIINKQTDIITQLRKKLREVYIKTKPAKERGGVK